MTDETTGPESAGKETPPGRRARGVDPRERVCRELAELLATPEGLRTARLAGLVGLVEPAPAPVPEEPPPKPPRETRPISIWQPEVRGGETVFVRPPVGPLGDHHATTPVLTPRRGPLPRRICWFGESAAAGYLYAPHRTPGQVLEAQLRAVAGEGSYEIVDLARTNETLGPLVTTVERSLQLDPDLLVVYTGNNWPLLETSDVSPYVPSVRDRQALGATLRPDRPGSGEDDDRGNAEVSGAVGLSRKRLALRATAALDRLAEIARRAEIPLLLVIPEVNLGDWEAVQPPIWLTGDATARWHALFDHAREALASEDWAGVEHLAWQLNALDGSSCPTPFRLLARAWRAQGRLDEARDAARAEVDSVHSPLLCCLAAPQTTTAVRNLLSDAARRHDLPTVDLRQVFAEHTGSPLPDRRMFLDYCHLTAEGMHVLGAAVTEQVLRLCPVVADEAARSTESVQMDESTGSAGADQPATSSAPAGAGARASRSWQQLAATLPQPEISPEAEATARLGAAIHTAHRLLPLRASAPVASAAPAAPVEAAGQTEKAENAEREDPAEREAPFDVHHEILDHWCAAALDASPGVAAAMVDLVTLRLALLDDTPAVLTDAFRRLQASPYRMTLQHGLRWNNLDLPVLRAIATALRRAGRPEADTVDRLLAAAGRRASAEVDLVRDERRFDLVRNERFLAAPLERPLPDAMDLRDLTGRATLRAVWPETTFEIPISGESDLTLGLTARLPPIPTADPSDPLATDRTGQAEIVLQPTARHDAAPASPSTVARPTLTAAWTHTTLHLPTDRLPPGLHRLTIRWPPLPPLGTEALQAARHRLEIGAEADLHPIFGEVASLRLRP